MDEGANCAKTDDDCLPNRKLNGEMNHGNPWLTYLKLQIASGRSKLLKFAENIFFYTCIFAAVAKNRWQIESKSWNFFFRVSKCTKIDILFLIGSIPIPLLLPLSTNRFCVCVLFLVSLCFAVSRFVDFAGMSL